MTKPLPRENDSFWLPISTLARVFAQTPQGFRSSILPLVAANDRRQSPGGLEIFARAALEAWAGREWERQARQIAGDSILGGPNSPALEKAREFKAALLEIDLYERRGSVVCLDDVRDFHVKVFAGIRRAGDRLSRECGEHARKILDDAITDVELLAHIGSKTPDVGLEAAP